MVLGRRWMVTVERVRPGAHTHEARVQSIPATVHPAMTEDGTPAPRTREFDTAATLGWWYGAYGFPRDGRS
jgi:hypothetical protein